MSRDLSIYPLSAWSDHAPELTIDFIIDSFLPTLDDRLGHVGFAYFTTLIDPHEDRECELRWARMETTAVIWEDLWKHRDDATWRIDTRTTHVGFLVEWTSLDDILWDVGDMDPEEIVSPLVSCYRYRVIEILSIGSVDRHRRPASQIVSFLCIDRYLREYTISWELLAARDFSLEIERSLHRGICLTR